MAAGRRGPLEGPRVRVVKTDELLNVCAQGRDAAIETAPVMSANKAQPD